MSILNLFLPLSGVKNRPRARPAPSRENRSPPPLSMIQNYNKHEIGIDWSGTKDVSLDE